MKGARDVGEGAQRCEEDVGAGHMGLDCMILYHAILYGRRKLLCIDDRVPLCIHISMFGAL